MERGQIKRYNYEIKQKLEHEVNELALRTLLPYVKPLHVTPSDILPVEVGVGVRAIGLR